jgi:hypothetical protein
MPTGKTEHITINCSQADVSAYDKSRVSVFLNDVDIDSLLDDINNEDIIEWCQKNRQVEDIFSESELDKWAEANGYVKADSHAD